MSKEKVETQECIMEEPFRSKMQELLETGAVRPTDVTMSEWYYMQDHAQKCNYCLERFEELAKKARKNGPIDGPTTLRK